MLDPPETRGDDLRHQLNVEVDVRLDSAEQAEVAVPEPVEEPPVEAEPAPEPETRVETAAEAEPQPPSTAFPGDRRRAPRRAYPRRVPAFGDRAMRVLVARDLSMGGMRVEHDSGLEMGDRLHLAIYGAADEEPFLVWATVGRDDDGDGSIALVFDEVHPLIAQQLEKVVATLPAVESLHDDEARAMGTVVTEILEH